MKYKCSNGHENVAYKLPERCPQCGSSLLRVVSAGGAGDPLPPPKMTPPPAAKAAAPTPAPAAATPAPAPAPAPAASTPAAPTSVPAAKSGPATPPPIVPPLAAPATAVKHKSKAIWVVLGILVSLIGLAVLVVLAVGAWWTVKPVPGAKPAAGVNPIVAPTHAEWTPTVMMGGEIFPSYLIASATMKPDMLPKPDATNVLGDAVGILGVSIISPADQTRVKVVFEANPIMQTSAIEVELPKQGEAYMVCPKINYSFEALLHAKQAIPLTLTMDVTVGSGQPQQKSMTVRLNSINDCPFAVMSGTDNKAVTPLDWMFAAYVNENHPWSEEVRKEALKTGVVDSFAGYQVPPVGVLKQVFSIWHVFQKRGFKYSNITSSSSENGLVGLQQVRFVDQSIQSSQANCVDGSVLFASVLRQIGIEPILVKVPGHMFVGFFTTSDLNHSNACFLETTMMGMVDASPAEGLAGGRPAMADISGIRDVQGQPLDAMADLKQKVKTCAEMDSSMVPSFNSFVSAVKTANGEFSEHYKNKEATLIPIQAARQNGVMPIAYQP